MVFFCGFCYAAVRLGSGMSCWPASCLISLVMWTRPFISCGSIHFHWFVKWRYEKGTFHIPCCAQNHSGASETVKDKGLFCRSTEVLRSRIALVHLWYSIMVQRWIFLAQFWTWPFSIFSPFQPARCVREGQKAKPSRYMWCGKVF